MIKIFFLSFIIVFAFTTAYEAILFEMKFCYNNNLKENQFHFFNNLYNSYLYTYLKIGEPTYDIKAIFSIFTHHFSLNPTFDNINEKFGKNFYNIYKSFTFRNIVWIDIMYLVEKILPQKKHSK